MGSLCGTELPNPDDIREDYETDSAKCAVLLFRHQFMLFIEINHELRECSSRLHTDQIH